MSKMKEFYLKIFWQKFREINFSFDNWFDEIFLSGIFFFKTQCGKMMDLLSLKNFVKSTID